MRQIAGEVGIQAGALYNYTPDKQSLLFGLMRGHMHDLMEARAARPEADGAVAQLEDFVRIHFAFHPDRPDAVFNAYMELRNLTPDHFATIEILRRAYQDILEAVLRQGVAQGVFPVPDPKIVTLAVIAMQIGVNTWYRPDRRLPLNRAETIHWDIVRKTVVR